MVESEQLAIDTAGQLKEICDRLDVPFIYKSSFDKANRTSSASFRGLGVEEGLRILAEVKRQVGVPVLTDVHEDTDIEVVANVVDVLQTPAFLCRQTNFIRSGRGARGAGQHQERPVSEPLGNAERGRQGPRNRQSITSWFANAGLPSATTTWSPTCARSPSCERPAARWYSTLRIQCSYRVDRAPRPGGQREFVPVLSRAAVAVGVSGLFMETHPDPDKALSDGPNAWPLGKMEQLLTTLKALDTVSKQNLS